VRSTDPHRALWRHNWLFFWGTLVVIIATTLFVLASLGSSRPLVTFGVLVGLFGTARLAKENGVTIARIEMLEDLERLTRRAP
jgi:hypothetical protein